MLILLTSNMRYYIMIILWMPKRVTIINESVRSAKNKGSANVAATLYQTARLSVIHVDNDTGKSNVVSRHGKRMGHVCHARTQQRQAGRDVNLAQRKAKHVADAGDYRLQTWSLQRMAVHNVDVVERQKGYSCQLITSTGEGQDNEGN